MKDVAAAAPYTGVANSFIDYVMADCKGATVKVFLYLCRRINGTTKGRRCNSDSVAVSQICNGIRKLDGEVLDRGTGLGTHAVIDALAELESLGVVVRKRGSGTTADTYILTPQTAAQRWSGNPPNSTAKSATLTDSSRPAKSATLALRKSQRSALRFSQVQKKVEKKTEIPPHPVAPTNGAETSHFIEKVAAQIHKRHPARKCSLNQVRTLLSRILKHPGIEDRGTDSELLSRIDRNHDSWSKSQQWAKDDCQFVPGLERWLSPNGEKYLEGPRMTTEGAGEKLYSELPEWKGFGRQA